MAALTLEKIRSFVRLHLDIEEIDLPNEVLDEFVRDGSERVEQAEPRWPFYEGSWPLVVTAGNRGPYEFTIIAEELDEIAAVEGDNYQLVWLGYDTYTRYAPKASEGQSRPSYYTWWARELHFYPTPDQDYPLTVRGYRKPNDWVSEGAGASPDLPEELHRCVQDWALSRAYSQQEDPELAVTYERQAVDRLNVFRKRLTETPHPQPIVVGGRESYGRSFPNRLLFPFEV